MNRCTVPPPGWECSREPGHEGPCAASPAFTEGEVVTLTVWRCPVHGFRGSVCTSVGPNNASFTYCAERVGRDLCMEEVERLEVVPATPQHLETAFREFVAGVSSITGRMRLDGQQPYGDQLRALVEAARSDLEALGDNHA